MGPCKCTRGLRLYDRPRIYPHRALVQLRAVSLHVRCSRRQFSLGPRGLYANAAIFFASEPKEVLMVNLISAGDSTWAGGPGAWSEKVARKNKK